MLGRCFLRTLCKEQLLLLLHLRQDGESRGPPIVVKYQFPAFDSVQWLLGTVVQPDEEDRSLVPGVFSSLPSFHVSSCFIATLLKAEIASTLLRKEKTLTRESGERKIDLFPLLV